MDNNLKTVDCLIMLQAAYPRVELGSQTIKVYQIGLADIDPQLLQAAVLQHIATSKWFPTIAELRQRVVEERLTAAGHLSAPEAWSLVMRQVRSVGHWRVPDVPPAVRKAIDASGGWRQLCLSENPTADRARFLEAYKLFAKEESEKLQQMPSVNHALEELSSGKDRVHEEITKLLTKRNGCPPEADGG